MMTTASGINTPHKKKVEKIALFVPIIPKISTSDIYSLQDYFYKMCPTDNMPMWPALQPKVQHTQSQRATSVAKKIDFLTDFFKRALALTVTTPTPSKPLITYYTGRERAWLPA